MSQNTILSLIFQRKRPKTCIDRILSKCTGSTFTMAHRQHRFSDIAPECFRKDIYIIWCNLVENLSFAS